MLLYNFFNFSFIEADKSRKSITDKICELSPFRKKDKKSKNDKSQSDVSEALSASTAPDTAHQTKDKKSRKRSLFKKRDEDVSDDPSRRLSSGLPRLTGVFVPPVFEKLDPEISVGMAYNKLSINFILINNKITKILFQF